MKNVEYLNPICAPDPGAVKFVHILHNGHWHNADSYPNDYSRVVYLGKDYDWDIFCCYGVHDLLRIYRGHLNSGKY
jgi:hypothetical protein